MEVFSNYQAVAVFVGICLVLWVVRIPITFRLYSLGVSISALCNWDVGEDFFAREAIACFYYHPEWFNSSPDDPRYKLFRRSFEETNLGEPKSIDGKGRATITQILEEMEELRKSRSD